MKFSKLYILALIPSLLIVSCESDDDGGTTTTDPTTTTAELSIHIDHEFDTEAFALGESYTLSNNKVVKFSTAQFYISNVTLMDDDQNMTAFDDKYLLITPDVSHEHIGDIDVEHYHMVSMTIGLDSTKNTSVQPTDFSTDHPLGAKENNMWWSWNAGYIFYKFEGEVDQDGDGTFDDNFIYHIGTNANALSKQTMFHTTVTAGSELEVEMVVDYSKIFNNIDLTTELEARMMPMDVVAKIVANTQEAIDFE